MTDQKPSPEPEYTPQETAALEAEIDAFLAMGHRFAGRSFTVEVGQIGPDDGLLARLVKIGPNAGLLADLVDSLCDGPDPKGSE